MSKSEEYGKLYEMKSDETQIFESITKMAPAPPVWGFVVEGGIWKFDRHGIRFERDDGSEVTVATVPTVDGEDEE